MTFGERLKKSIRQQGYTQAKFAELIYVSPTNLWRWMHGLSEPKINDLKRICIILNISADWLLGVNDEN